MEAISGAAIGLPLVTHLGVVASLTAQHTRTWHEHRGFELLFVLHGATAWEFRDRPLLEVAGGQVLIVPPGSVHRVERAMRKPSALCGVVCDPLGRASRTLTPFTAADMRRINEGLLAAAGTPWAMGPRLAAEVTQLLALKERFEADPRQPLVAAALRTCVCTVIHETASGHGGAPADAAAALVAAARAYLLAHLDERVRIPDLVRHLGFSRSHLFTIFRSATGMTPNDYLLRLRLGEAQRLLARQRDSITVIALRTGFSSSQYFSSVFRKYTGQTPQDFRATCRV